MTHVDTILQSFRFIVVMLIQSSYITSQENNPKYTYAFVEGIKVKEE